MPPGTHEQLEEVEHVQHAVHDVFNRNVAMTMAIIAATLAAVTMLSHRSHTETVRLQALSSTRHTQATDIWTYYQAKNIRSHQYALFQELTGFLVTDPAAKDAQVTSAKNWGEKVAKYEAELPTLKAKAEGLEAEGDRYQAGSAAVHHKADRFDLGELGIEMGLVLASLAVLTRRKLFWVAGIVAAIAGILVAASAFFVH